jgi:hypothetical protein
MPKQPFLYFTFPHVGEMVVAVLTGAIIFQIFVRLRYARKVRSAGNIHAPMLAKDPFTGNELLIRLLCTADPHL